MITFTVNGTKHEFDDDRLSNLELREVRKVTGLGYKEFWEAFAEVDADAATALVLLARRRDGEPDLKFSEVEFDLMEFMESMTTDKTPPDGGTDGESDPTPAAVEPDPS